MPPRPSPSHRQNRPARGGHQSVWLFGRHAVLAALANPDRRVERVLATKEFAERHATELGNKVEVFSRDDLAHRLPAGAVHQGIAALAAEMKAGKIKTLVCINTNPVYDAPAVQVLTFYSGMPAEPMANTITTPMERTTGQAHCTRRGARQGSGDNMRLSWSCAN